MPSAKMPQEEKIKKRLIVCCDGTWMDSLGKEGAEPPSNVTRITRVLKRTCHDGTHQVIMYDPGVGSGGLTIDRLTGGAFGMGLAQNIREVYNFICTNYVDGDEIILIGFSRGAFTARSVADMIGSIGLLTPDGLDQFYKIFNDYEHMGSTEHHDNKFMYPNLLPYNGEKGLEKTKWEERRKDQYRQLLKDQKLTRDTYNDSKQEIKVKALGVWDTVGTLGIPPAPVFGIRGSASQWKFTNTEISHKVENAFQALALDEPRYAFRPSLWERPGSSVTNLKQVWFAGNHGGVGGGWHDQQIATISLAWMCDQLSSVGVEFNQERMKMMFMDGLGYSAAHPYPHIPSTLGWPWRSDAKAWANEQICVHKGPVPKCDAANCPGKEHHAKGERETLWPDARPWGLGQIRYPTSWVQTIVGRTVRHPGMTLRVDADTNTDTDQPLLNTSERIHSSVRVRLACGGLGMDDKEPWKCPSLLDNDHDEPLWKLEREYGLEKEEIAALGATPPELVRSEDKCSSDKLYDIEETDARWRWVYVNPRKGLANVPQATVLPEEPLTGYWERYLLWLTTGKMDVWRWAQKNPPRQALL